MNTMTARALMVGVLIAIWAWLASVARLNVSMWAGVVALGCFYASGGGVAGLQKTIVATVSGVVWVLIADAVRVAIAGHGVGWAVILGAMACALALPARASRSASASTPGTRRFVPASRSRSVPRSASPPSAWRG